MSIVFVYTVKCQNISISNNSVYLEYSFNVKKPFHSKQFSLELARSLNAKTVPFQVVQFSISKHFSSIWPIDRTLSCASTPNQNGAGSNGNEVTFHIPKSFSVTWNSPSDCWAWYPGHSFEVCYTSAKKKSVYFTAPADKLFMFHRTVWQKYNYTSSSSSYRAGSTDIPDPLSPLLPIVHRPR